MGEDYSHEQPETEFNPFAGYTRNPSLDQPRLVSSQNGFEDHAIPAQVGFLAPGGAEVQISYSMALALGMIEPTVIPTVRIDKWRRVSK